MTWIAMLPETDPKTPVRTLSFRTLGDAMRALESFPKHEIVAGGMLAFTAEDGTVVHLRRCLPVVMPSWMDAA
jgi:hypothetical protein